MSDLSQMSLASLGAWFAQNAQKHPAVVIEPPGAQGWDVPLPNVSFNTVGQGRPRIDAGFSIPAFGGQVGIEGNYQRPNDRSPANWAGMFGYKTSF